MKRFHTSVEIQAAPEKVWSILTDAPGWVSWNTTIDKLEGRIGLGEKVKLFVKLNPGRAFPVTVSTFDAPRRMVWTGGMPLGLFKGERTYTLAPKSGGVEFSMTEVFSGLMSPLIEKSIPDMQPAFDEFSACLKRRAEQA